MVPVSPRIDGNGCPAHVGISNALKALSRRGSRMVAVGAGFEVHCMRRGITQVAAVLDAPAAQAVEAAGWLTRIDANSFILSP